MLGRTTPRNVASALREVASSPFPAIGTRMSATVLSALTVMNIGANIWPVATARRLKFWICAEISLLRTLGAWTTTSAGVGAPGNAAITCLYVCTIGSSFGMSVKLGSFVCIPKSGNAAATSNPAASAVETIGLRNTRSSTYPQKRDSPAACFRRPKNGTRPRSTRSPSFESAAGRTVSEPTTAQSTTSIVPNAIDVKILLLAMNIPAMAISTVMPEISTA